MLDQCDQLDRGMSDIWFLDDHDPVMSKDPPELLKALFLVGKMVEGVHHHDAVKALTGKREVLGMACYKPEARLLSALGKHTYGRVQDDNLAGPIGEAKSDPARSAAGIQESGIGIQAGEAGELVRILGADQAIVDRGQQVKVVEPSLHG